MPEKLMLREGDYPCQWTYRGRVIAGQLALEGSQVPTGEMVDAPGTWIESDGHKSFSPHANTVRALRGRLRNGYETALLDVRIDHMLPERSWLQARMALVGTDLPEDLLFDSVAFQVGGLTELAGVYPFKSISLPEAFNTDVAASGTWNAEAAAQTWTNEDGDDLSLEFTAFINNHHWYGFSLAWFPRDLAARDSSRAAHRLRPQRVENSARSCGSAS